MRPRASGSNQVANADMWHHVQKRQEYKPSIIQGLYGRWVDVCRIREQLPRGCIVGNPHDLTLQKGGISWEASM